MNQKYLISLGYNTILAFDDKETAMRAYVLLTESTPVENFYFGSGFKLPESMKEVAYVRKSSDLEIELKRVDNCKFALHLTEEELREKSRIQPTEVEGEVRLIEEAPIVVSIEGPAGDTQDDEFGPF
jgi:hypothetical protein